ncbi:hypothetical protein BH09ACT3_BH09ACT3_07270 [soil metagenome]
MIAANSAAIHSLSCSNSSVSGWVGGAGGRTATVSRIMSSPPVGTERGSGQALILFASFRVDEASWLPMLIFRGFACSAIGIRSRSTPAV